MAEVGGRDALREIRAVSLILSAASSAAAWSSAAGDHEQPLGPGQALGQHARLRWIREQRTHRVRERGEVVGRERRGAERGGYGGDGEQLGR